MRATGDATLVQLASLGSVLASIEGALSMGGHNIPSIDLTLYNVRIVLLSRVGDGRSRQACSCDGEEFRKMDHFEQARYELVVCERLDSWPQRPGFISHRSPLTRVILKGSPICNTRYYSRYCILHSLALSGSKHGASSTQACLAPRQQLMKAGGWQSLLHELIQFREDRLGQTNHHSSIGNKFRHFPI